MDVVQRSKDLGLMLMLAAALTIGLAHVRAEAAQDDGAATSATTAACAVDAASDGDRSDEWVDPLEDGIPGNPH